MTFYPERKNNSKAAFAAGLGIGVALTAAGIYAYKKFKETHPNFNLKEYCEKCGILSDECDWNCDSNCDECTCMEPSYDDCCDIEDIEVDLTTDSDDEDGEETDDEDGTPSLTGKAVITFEEAKAKVSALAEKLYGCSSLCNDNSSDNMLLTNDGKTRKCYMFWIESKSDDVTPVAVFYVDILTGEIFDNSEKAMKKISD